MSEGSTDLDNRDRQRRGDRAAWATATLLVVACGIVGYAADGWAAAAFMVTLVGIGVKIGVVWWIKVGRKQFE